MRRLAILVLAVVSVIGLAIAPATASASPTVQCRAVTCF